MPHYPALNDEELLNEAERYAVPPRALWKELISRFEKLREELAEVSIEDIIENGVEED